MSLAEDIPRLDVLRALRVVDFNVVKAVMLLELVRIRDRDRETHTLQDVVMDALITDALSEEEQAKLEQLMRVGEYAERVNAFRAFYVFGDIDFSDALLNLVYEEAFGEDETEDSYLLEDQGEEGQAEIKQVISLAGNVSNWQALLALSIFDFDVEKAAMLLALIISQNPALGARNTVS
jgi:hypothetical protein